jgi:EmrB/QacA subfamily drug resistance transporter
MRVAGAQEHPDHLGSLAPRGRATTSPSTIAPPTTSSASFYIELDQLKDEALGCFDPRPWHRDTPQRPRVWARDTTTIRGRRRSPISTATATWSSVSPRRLTPLPRVRIRTNREPRRRDVGCLRERRVEIFVPLGDIGTVRAPDNRPGPQLQCRAGSTKVGGHRSGGISLPAITDENRKWWILAAMGTVLGVVTLDETVVGVTLPTMIRELGLTTVASHWVINAYLLVFTVLAAAAGRLGDIISLRLLFVVGLAIFALASLACGFAESGNWLIALRAAQGIGAAVIFPGSLAMMTHAFPEEQRGLAMGIYGSIGTALLSLGPLAGGFFSEFLSWRWIFWINPPIVALVALVVLAAWRDPPRERAAVKLDVPGLIALIIGLGLAVFAVMQGPDWGWSHLGIWLVLAAGIVVLIAFVVIELRVSQPLIDVVLFRNGAFTTFNLAVFSAQFSKIAVFVFVAVYLQNVLGYGPLLAGTAILVATIPTFLTAFPTGILLDRVGTRVLVVGASAAGVIAMLALALATIWESGLLLFPALIVWGVCISLWFVPSLRDVMNTVPPDKRGEAGGISMTAQLLGGTVGMTICGALLATTSAYWPIYALNALLFTVLFALGRRYIAPLRKAKATAGFLSME